MKLHLAFLLAPLASWGALAVPADAANPDADALAKVDAATRDAATELLSHLPPRVDWAVPAQRRSPAPRAPFVPLMEVLVTFSLHRPEGPGPRGWKLKARVRSGVVLNANSASLLFNAGIDRKSLAAFLYSGLALRLIERGFQAWPGGLRVKGFVRGMLQPNEVGEVGVDIESATRADILDLSNLVSAIIDYHREEGKHTAYAFSADAFTAEPPTDYRGHVNQPRGVEATYGGPACKKSLDARKFIGELKPVEGEMYYVFCDGLVSP